MDFWAILGVKIFFPHFGQILGGGANIPSEDHHLGYSQNYSFYALRAPEAILEGM